MNPSRPFAWTVAVLGVVLAAGTAGARETLAVKDANVPAPVPLHVTYGFVPNDAYFHKDTPLPGFYGQWHLSNEYVPGRDLNVAGAWARGLTGAGVVTAVVDDCLQRNHPDLAPNYDAANSWDFGQGDSDPSPVYYDDGHGVSTAGLLAARGGNGTGVTGVAPQARIAGLRIDFAYQTEQMFIDATLYHSSGSNTSIQIKSHSYGVRDDYIHTSAEAAAVNLSASYGTIHVFAAGNEGHDVNKKDLQNQASAITVAALGSQGRFAGYSNYGACIFATVPSSSDTGFWITTTDRTGEDGYNDGGAYRSSDPFPDADYTSQFGGTSACAPQLAGVLALAKEVRPNLDVRFAKHLLVKTCRRVDLTDQSVWSDGGWRANAAGNWFNQNYGFGLVDADALAQAAALCAGVTPLQTETTPKIGVRQTIPDNDEAGVTRTFTLSSSTPLEDLIVTVDANHSWWGDLNIVLTSPSGTVSRLVMGREGGPGEPNQTEWTFTSDVFWGENPRGTWKINVADIWAGDEGIWNSFQVTANMGALVPEPATVVTLFAAVAWALSTRAARMARTARR